MSKIKAATEVIRREGYWSLLLKASQLVKSQVESRAAEDVAKSKRGSYRTLCKGGAFNRPHYGFSAWLVGKQAERLGYEKVSLIEFGVAGGNGLLNLEKHASRLEKQLDISYEIYGFDLGEGLPAPADYRDSPYHWDRGHYKMDVELLEKKIDRSELILGDVADTTPNFVSEYDPAPIGAMYVDLDYYSSTKDAFEILSVEDEYILPRVSMYFDDILDGHGLRMTIPQIGELLAIKEFNQDSDQEAIGKLQMDEEEWSEIRPRRQYAYHRFDHNMYAKYIGKEDRQIPLDIDE